MNDMIISSCFDMNLQLSVQNCQNLFIVNCQLYFIIHNRTMKGVTTRYNYDNRNRLIEKIEGGMQTAYRYDPQGNLLEEEGRRGTTRYTYDCFNRTESVRTAEGGYIRNRYDAEGLRYELYENGKFSRFIFSGREVVTEVDADYGLKTAIIRGHELLAQKDNKDSSITSTMLMEMLLHWWTAGVRW